jgi:hypothetical protein
MWRRYIPNTNWPCEAITRTNHSASEGNATGKRDPALGGEQFESAIAQTEGFSFAELRETYILGAQSAFERGRESSVAGVIEAVELQTAGADELRSSRAVPGFTHKPERFVRR